MPREYAMSVKYLPMRVAGRLKAPFQEARRGDRMARFMEQMELKGGERVLDMGGLAAFWNDCPVPLDLTIVNLPGSGLRGEVDPRHTVTYVEGNACEMPFVEDMSFDIAFSNSVIEHVGPPENQRRFAAEAQRVAPRHWIQTPSIWFPVEAHNHMPFWWFYPPVVKRFFLCRWRAKLPAWAEMIDGTTVILRRDLQAMFPDSTLWSERFLGFTKSYVAYR